MLENGMRIGLKVSATGDVSWADILSERCSDDEAGRLTLVKSMPPRRMRKPAYTQSSGAHKDSASKNEGVSKAELKSVPEDVGVLLQRFRDAKHRSADGGILEHDSVTNYAAVIKNLYRHEHLHSLDELINLPEAGVRAIAKNVDANYKPNCQPPLPRGNDSRRAMLLFLAWYRDA
jgi:hypothetical protein